MSFTPVPAEMIRMWQDSLSIYGRHIDYVEESVNPAIGRPMRARVHYLTAAELINSIEQYAIRVTVDARQFVIRAPQKGDTVIVDNGRRGVMSVSPISVGPTIFAYSLGVQG
jgi:hypothetical protein